MSRFSDGHSRKGFTLIELLVVIAIIAILAVVVVLTLNPAELLRQSRDANRVSDMATLTSALNLYTTDVGGSSSFNLGLASDTYPSIYDPSATSTNACGNLGLPSLTTSTGQAWLCVSSSSYRSISSSGWIPVNLNNISAGTPIGSLPIDPTNQTSSGLFYAYNTNGTQFEVTGELESSKYKATYANSPQTSLFPEVISGGTQNISALYNNSGLVGYWPLNEGSGSSTVDQSGNGNNGTWNGSSTNGSYYTTGKVGANAGVFSSANANVVGAGATSTGTLDIGIGSFSIALWVNASSFSGTPIPISKGSASNACTVSTSMGYEVRQFSTNYDFYVCYYGDGTMGTALSPTFTTSDGQWHYLVAVLDRNSQTLRLYTDGIGGSAVSKNFGADNITNNSIQLTIGARASDRFTGNLDDVRIYNRALSPAEIMALYNAQK